MILDQRLAWPTRLAGGSRTPLVGGPILFRKLRFAGPGAAQLARGRGCYDVLGLRLAEDERGTGRA